VLLDCGAAAALAGAPPSNVSVSAMAKSPGATRRRLGRGPAGRKCIDLSSLGRPEGQFRKQLLPALRHSEDFEA
jgi:hypothetical protein